MAVSTALFRKLEQIHLLEITSRMHARDIDAFSTLADDYERREGVKPKLLVATSDVSPHLMQKIMGLARPIEIFSYEGEASSFASRMRISLTKIRMYLR